MLLLVTYIFSITFTTLTLKKIKKIKKGVDNFMKDLSKTDTKIPLKTFKDMKNRVDKYILGGGTITDDRRIYLVYPSDNSDYVTYYTYKDMLQRYNNFITQNHREPNYITCTTTTTKIVNKNCYTNPRYYDTKNLMRQETSYYCGVNSVQQTIYSITGKYYTETQLAKLLGTTKNGTSPSAMVNVIKKILTQLGYTVTKCQWENFSNYTWKQIGEMLEDKKTAIVFHDYYRLKYGHYEVASKICLNNKTITILNSLSGGYIENRSFNTMEK